MSEGSHMTLIGIANEDEDLDSPKFAALGQKVTSVDRLDIFPRPRGVDRVRLVVKEFTSVCPVTGQPDFSEIDIEYIPREWCIESKSLKLFLWQYRNRGVFCEALSAELSQTIRDQIDAEYVEVTVHQAARGGIEIHSTSTSLRTGSDVDFISEG